MVALYEDTHLQAQIQKLIKILQAVLWRLSMHQATIVWSAWSPWPRMSSFLVGTRRSAVSAALDCRRAPFAGYRCSPAFAFLGLDADGRMY